MGEIFCDAKSMDTQYKRNYSNYCVKIEKDIRNIFLIEGKIYLSVISIMLLISSFQAPVVFGKIYTRIDIIKIIRLCT